MAEANLRRGGGYQVHVLKVIQKSKVHFYEPSRFGVLRGACPLCMLYDGHTLCASHIPSDSLYDV